MTEQVINEYLEILESVKEDNSIESYQFREHTPQLQNFNNGDEIIIDVNTDNSYILPSESFLRIDGQLRKNNANHGVYDVNDEISLINNAMMYLFNQISYSIEGREMERILCPGQISSMLGYLKYPDDFSTSSALESCWSKDTTNHASSSEFEASVVVPNTGVAAGALTPRKNAHYNQGFHIRKSFLMSANPRGSFQFLIPFSHMFGFAEYKKIIWGMKHSLKLTPNSNRNLLAIHKNAVADAGEVWIERVSWSIPYIKVEPVTKARLMEIVEKKINIPVSFCARTAESISVPANCTQFNWRLSTTGGVEKPRWIIIGFQTARNTTQEQNPAVFDHLSLTNAYVELNSERYPAFDLNINFNTNRYLKLYKSFNDFKQEYYGISSLVGGTQVNLPAFKSLFPIIVFDVRQQDEKIKSGVVDMQLTFFFEVGVPANTMAYSCVISDRVFKFAPDGKSISVKSM